MSAQARPVDPAQGDELEDLADMLAEPRIVRAGGRDVQVRPITPRQIPSFVKAIRPLQNALGAGLSLDALQGAALLGLVEDHAEDVVQAVAVATRQSPDFIGDEIDIAELVELTAAVIEVNADFFARRVAPALVTTVARLQQLRSGGLTPSSVS